MAFARRYFVLANAAAREDPWLTCLDPATLPELVAAAGLELIGEAGAVECMQEVLNPLGRAGRPVRIERVAQANVGGT